MSNYIKKNRKSLLILMVLAFLFSQSINLLAAPPPACTNADLTGNPCKNTVCTYSGVTYSLGCAGLSANGSKGTPNMGTPFTCPASVPYKVTSTISLLTGSPLMISSDTYNCCCPTPTPCNTTGNGCNISASPNPPIIISVGNYHPSCTSTTQRKKCVVDTANPLNINNNICIFQDENCPATAPLCNSQSTPSSAICTTPTPCSSCTIGGTSVAPNAYKCTGTNSNLRKKCQRSGINNSICTAIDDNCPADKQCNPSNPPVCTATPCTGCLYLGLIRPGGSFKCKNPGTSPDIQICSLTMCDWINDNPCNGGLIMLICYEVNPMNPGAVTTKCSPTPTASPIPSTPPLPSPSPACVSAVNPCNDGGVTNGMGNCCTGFFCKTIGLSKICSCKNGSAGDPVCTGAGQGDCCLGFSCISGMCCQNPGEICNVSAPKCCGGTACSGNPNPVCQMPMPSPGPTVTAATSPFSSPSSLPTRKKGKTIKPKSLPLKKCNEIVPLTSEEITSLNFLNEEGKNKLFVHAKNKCNLAAACSLDHTCKFVLIKDDLSKLEYKCLCGLSNDKVSLEDCNDSKVNNCFPNKPYIKDGTCQCLSEEEISILKTPPAPEPSDTEPILETDTEEAPEEDL